MEPLASWQDRHAELHAKLRQIGSLLGERNRPTAEQKHTAAEFVSTWQEFCQHIKQNPDVIHAMEPRG